MQSRNAMAHWPSATLPAIMLAYGCGLACSSTDDAMAPDGAAPDGTASAACAVCGRAWFTCSTPGWESVDFQVEEQTAVGCKGHIIQFSGPTTEYTIDCPASQICDATGCKTATLTPTSFSWGNATCTSNGK